MACTGEKIFYFEPVTEESGISDVEKWVVVEPAIDPKPVFQ